MRRPRSNRAAMGTAVVCSLAFTFGAAAQADMNISAPTVQTPPDAMFEFPAPDDPAMAQYRDFQKRRVDVERQLRKIRATYFRNIRNIEIRQAGIERLRDFTDPASFPSLLDIFRREGDDVREAILDHLAALGTDESDGTLAWTAVFDDEKKIRRSAAERLTKRYQQTGEVSESVLWVVATGLRKGRSDVELGSAAHVANILRIYDAIPMMINAQVGGGGARSGDGTGALAYILVGTQQAFVSDLTPVVADSAVGFDPTISVITEGVVMRVIDAAVITYHMDVYYSLVDLASAGMGQPVPGFGFDDRKWREWYADEFLPHRRELERVQIAPSEGEPVEPPPGGGG
ncbi:MAG: hypothetical protein IID31_00435 [Planctomycetes bacterium]|nr:hypothetical protein [Planctomycetota bacterium]